MQSPSPSKLAAISPSKLSYKDDLRLKGFKELLYMIRNADPESI